MEQNRWLKLVFKCDPILVEPLSDFLMGVIGAGVETGAKDELSFGTINCYLEDPNLDEQTVNGILNKISGYLKELADIFQTAVPTFSFNTLGDEDWGKKWKEHFKPFAIVPGLIISPSWENYEVVADEKVMIMDPGMAFGTGHHATTRMSLELLSEVIDREQKQKVLDIGTGTGILGMAAVHFGAIQVLGIDNDPEAVSVTRENVLINAMQDYMQTSLQPLTEIQESYNVVVANIVHDVLVTMVKDIRRVTASGGHLVLSGVLAGKQAENIIELYEKYGYAFEQQLIQQEWTALCLKRLEG